MSTCLEAALSYAARGWRVFPCKLHSKEPATLHGFKDATTDPTRLASLFSTDCNLGIATGQGLFVLDIDVKASNGETTLQAWEARYGPLPRTYTVRTPSGGTHYYFLSAVCPTKAAVAPGLDVRGDGGYVVAPPSAGYAVLDPLDPVKAPAWLLAQCTSKKRFAKGSRNVDLTSAAGSLKRAGIEGPALVEAIKGINATLPHPLPEKEVHTIAHSVDQYAAPAWSQFNIPTTGGKGQPICNADAALQVLEQHPLFADAIWLDTFSNAVMTTWEKRTPSVWQEADTQRLLIFLQRTIRLSKMSKSSVEDALGVFVLTRTRHAVTTWLHTLTWDGTPRMELCLSTFFGAVDVPYVRAASRNFWLSLIARVTHPGCQMDHMVILEGPQNLGKTKALRILGGPWYLSMSESVMEKDFFQSLQGKLIIEIAEMDSFRGFAEMNRVKQVLSTPIDHYRMPYGRRAVSYPRQCIFVGTTNETNYLRDPTGARRFWPIACGAIDIPALELAREQLFAEAAATFRPGVTWWEMPSEVVEEQDSRHEEDAWEAPVQEFLLLRETVTIKDVLCDGLQVPLGQIHRGEALRVAAILRKMHWEKKRIRRGEKLFYQWVPPQEDGETLQVKDFDV